METIHTQPLGVFSNGHNNTLGQARVNTLAQARHEALESTNLRVLLQLFRNSCRCRPRHHLEGSSLSRLLDILKDRGEGNRAGRVKRGMG